MMDNFTSTNYFFQLFFNFWGFPKSTFFQLKINLIKFDVLNPKLLKVVGTQASDCPSETWSAPVFSWAWELNQLIAMICKLHSTWGQGDLMIAAPELLNTQERCEMKHFHNGFIGPKLRRVGNLQALCRMYRNWWNCIDHESELLWAQLKFSFTNSLSFDSLSVRVGETKTPPPRDWYITANPPPWDTLKW